MKAFFRELFCLLGVLVGFATTACFAGLASFSAEFYFYGELPPVWNPHVIMWLITGFVAGATGLKFNYSKKARYNILAGWCLVGFMVCTVLSTFDIEDYQHGFALLAVGIPFLASAWTLWKRANTVPLVSSAPSVQI